MHHRLRRVAAVLLAVAAIAAPVMLAPAADAKLTLPLKGAAKQVLQPTFGPKETSLNWAGYYVNATEGSPITQVSSSFITPKPKLLPPTLSASWVGIGGANTDDLIQAGVAYQSAPQADYMAWYLLMPGTLTRITSGCVGDNSCKVSPDDRVNTDIRAVGANQFKISIANVGKWTWSKTVTYFSSFSSAEWIYEGAGTSVPGVGFVANFLPANHDHIQFYNNVYTHGGVTKQLNDTDAVQVVLSPVGVVNTATPSRVKADSAFQVCPYKQTCAPQ